MSCEVSIPFFLDTARYYFNISRIAKDPLDPRISNQTFPGF